MTHIETFYDNLASVFYYLYLIDVLKIYLLIFTHNNYRLLYGNFHMTCHINTRRPY